MSYLSLALIILMTAFGIASSAWAMTLLLMMLLLEVSLQASIGLFRSIPALTNYIAAGTVLACVVRGFLRTERPMFGYFSRESAALLTILAWSIISLAWTPAQSLQASRNISATGYYIIEESVPYMVVFVLGAPLLMTSVADWRRTCRILLLLGPFIAASILLNPEISVRFGRLGTEIGGAVRSSPLALSQAGGMIAIVGALASSAKGQRGILLFRWAAFLGGAAVAVLSGTRGQALFAALCIALMFPLARPLRSVRAYASLIATAAVMVLAAVLLFEFALTQTDNDRWRAEAIASGANVRILNMMDLFGAFGANPLAWFIGLGFNAFTASSRQLTEGYSHNMFVDVLCEEGIPMFLLLCWVILSAARRVRLLLARYADMPIERASIATLAALALYCMLIAGKEGNLWSSWNVFMFLIIIVRIETRDRELLLPGAAQASLGDDGDTRQALAQPA